MTAAAAAAAALIGRKKDPEIVSLESPLFSLALWASCASIVAREKRASAR